MHTHFWKKRCCRFIWCKRPSKKFPDLPCLTSGKNRRQAFPEDSEQVKDDWGRGKAQSCVSYQDHALEPFREFTSSCNSWIGTVSWFTENWLSSFFFLSRKFIYSELLRSLSFGIANVFNSIISWRVLVWAKHHAWSAHEKKCAHACVQWSVLCTFTPVATGWTTIEIFSLANSFLKLFWAWICRCRSHLLSHHSLSCHPWECHYCHWWSQDDKLHHVGLGDQLEDDDDGCWRSEFCGCAKCSAPWKPSHSYIFWTSRSSVLFWRVLDFNGL